MSDLPPLMRDQRKVDQDHLRLLAIFHFVIAGMSVLGIGFLALHYSFMHAMISDPVMWRNQKNSGPPPQEFFAMFVWFYVFMGAICVVAALGNLFSGLFIRRQKHRIFSLVVACFDFLQFPLGTVLGVFTFLVLMRDSVRESYEERPR